MSNITLPRAHALQIREALMVATTPIPADRHTVKAALAALDAAFAEPEKERAEVAAPARNGVASSMEEIDILTPEVYRTTEPPAKPYPVAWMESPHGAIRANPLYRITAPQSLAWSIPLYAAPPAAAKPEPATDDQVAEADESHAPSWLDYRDGWRDAERFHGIRKEDGK